MGAIATARIDPELDAAFAQELPRVQGDVDAILKETANAVADEARNTAAFKDKTRMLRNSIIVSRSKFANGGWLVVAKSPHAHLIERGHLLVKKSKSGIVKIIGHVTAKPFMRPAAESGRRIVLAKLKAATNG